MMTSMTQKMLPRRVDGFGNIIVPDYPSVEALMKIGNPENTRHHGHLMNLIQSAYDGKDDVEDMLYAMNETHGGAWYDDLWSGIKDVGNFLWNNKDDIISVVKAVAPLIGGGMEFDDAYSDVVGGAVSRYAHTLSELKHFTFPALQSYIAKINKHFRNKAVPKSEKKYMSGIRKLKNSRIKQRKQSTKLFEKGEKKRATYMAKNRTSKGLFLPKDSSRKSGYMSRKAASDVNTDLGVLNRAAIKKAETALTIDEYDNLINDIDLLSAEIPSRLSFNKAVKARLVESGIKVPKKTKTTTKKSTKKSTMVSGPNVLGKVNKAALKEAESILNQGQYQNLLREIKAADERSPNSLFFNKLVKSVLRANGVKTGSEPGRTKPSYSKPAARDYEYDYTLADKDHSGIPLRHTGIIHSELPPPPNGAPEDSDLEDSDSEFEPPPILEMRAFGRPRKTTRKKSTRKPTKKAAKKSAKKPRKVRLI